MIDQKDFLEGAINSLEETSKEINGLKDALIRGISRPVSLYFRLKYR